MFDDLWLLVSAIIQSREYMCIELKVLKCLKEKKKGFHLYRVYYDACLWNYVLKKMLKTRTVGVCLYLM